MKLKDFGYVFFMIVFGKEKYCVILNIVFNFFISFNLYGGVVFVIVDKEYKNDL